MNRVVHFEIHASNQDAIQKFYESLFGWTFTDMGPAFGNYRVITTGPGVAQMTAGVSMDELGINGGLTKRSGVPTAPGTSPNAFVCIVAVDDVDALVMKAQELGATVALPAADVPQVGRLAYLLDPENNLFGVIKAIPPAQ